jgi:hypothetical protein
MMACDCTAYRQPIIAMLMTAIDISDVSFK